jgi:hypothetical protein
VPSSLDGVVLFYGGVVATKSVAFDVSVSDVFDKCFRQPNKKN